MFLTVLVSLLIIILLFGIIFTFFPAKRPFLTESDYAHRKTPWWQLYYASKYLNPVRRPASASVREMFKGDMGPDPKRETLKDLHTVRFKAVGDLMCRRDIIGEGGSDLWKYAGPFVFDADFRIGNLEFAVNPANVIEKILTYSVTPAHAEPLLGDKRFGGFDLVSLANNHINDSFSEGIVSTCNYLDRVGIAHVGANRSPQEQEDFPVLDVGGVKTAFLSYTFSTNDVPLDTHSPFGVNLVRFNALDDRDYDPSLILRHIELARKRGAELIVCSNHWGVEFEYYPSERLIRRAHELLDAGVDIILGHHPHILNPVERYRTKDGRSALVLYSLGNLTAFALKFRVQKMGMIAQIDIERGLDSAGRKVVRTGEVTLMPVVHLFRRVGGIRRHSVYPLIKFSREVQGGKVPEGCSSSQARTIVRLEREFRRFFTQNGIKYV